jgi:hypothetical protein
MTQDLRNWIQKVNNARTIASNKLSSLTFIEEKMRRLAAFDEWTTEQEIQWMNLEKEYKAIVDSAWWIK